MDTILTLLTDPAAWLALVTLTVMEVVLGIDNLLFISVLSNKLPEEQRSFARRVGIAGALLLRLVFLAAVVWIVKLTAPLFEVFGHAPPVAPSLDPLLVAANEAVKARTAHPPRSW